MSRSIGPEQRGRAVAGFTMIEVLVALAVVSVSLAAIGSLVATTVRGTRSLDTHLTLVEKTRALAAGLPDRAQLQLGSVAGEADGFGWRVNVLPFVATNVDPRLPTPWIPQTVVISVQSPAGPVFQLYTVRLRQRSGG